MINYLESAPEGCVKKLAVWRNWKACQRGDKPLEVSDNLKHLYEKHPDKLFGTIWVEKE